MILPYETNRVPRTPVNFTSGKTQQPAGMRIERSNGIIRP